MKFLACIVLAFIGLNLFGLLFAMGSSHPYQFRKKISVTLPTTTP